MRDDETQVLETLDLEFTDDEGSPFVGQQRALEAVELVLREAFTKRTATLLVLEGERGSGKSHLLQRARAIAVRKHSDVRVLSGVRRSRDPASYSPLAQMLLERLGVSLHAPANQSRARLMQTTSEILHSADAVRVSETAHLVGHILGVPFPDSPFTSNLSKRPQLLHERACAAACRLIEADAAEGPLLLLLDNLGRAEDEAVDLLKAVVGIAAPIAVIVAGKPPLKERLAEVEATGVTLKQSIEPLDEVATAAFLDAMIPGLERPPSALTAALVDRSQGNPSALKTLIEDLRETGVVRQSREGARIDLSRLESGSEGLRLDDVLRARLARLSPEERSLLERAAVVGELFWEGALLAQARAERPGVLGSGIECWQDTSDEQHLRQLLRQLEVKAFVERIESSDLPGLDEYTFQHAGLRTLLYDGLKEEERQRRHLLTARWLAGVSHVLPSGNTATTAVHLAHAGQREEAAQAYLEAAAVERKRMRTTMALRYVERALELMGDHALLTRIDALHQKGSLLTVLGRYDEAYPAFEQMLQRAWVLGARGKAGAALNRMARIHRQRGDHVMALDLLKRALSLFRAAHDQRGVASTLDDIAQVHRLQGALDHAVSAAKEALEIRTSSQDERGQAVSLNTIGYIELDRGRFEVAASRFAAALELRQLIGDHEGAVQTRIALGRLAFQQGHLERAIDIYRRALESAREMGNRRFESYLLHHLGEALLATGDLDDASGSLAEAKEVASELRDPRALLIIERTQGLLLLKRGDPEARATLLHALELAEGYGHSEAIGLAQRALAQIHTQTLFDDDGETAGGQDPAERYLRQAAESFRQAGTVHELARTLAALGYRMLERNRIDQGKQVLQEAAAMLERLMLPEAQRVRQTLADL